MNVANGAGGGVFTSHCNDIVVTFLDCSFTENVANIGGGLAMMDGGVNTINCHFEDSSAIKRGGAISVILYHGTQHRMVLMNSFFNHNTAEGNRSHISIEYWSDMYTTVIDIAGCTFQEGTANRGGEVDIAIHTVAPGEYLGNAISLYVTNCKILSNRADFASAIYVEAMSTYCCDVVTTINNTQFFNNTNQ